MWRGIGYLCPSLRELVKKQQRTSREADVETGQINGACQGTVPDLVQF